MANRIGKLVLANAEDVLPEKRNSLVGEGMPSTADYVDQQLRSSYIEPLDKAIIETDNYFTRDIGEIIKKPLPWKLIALEILQYVNRYLERIRRRDEQVRDDIISTRSDSKPPPPMPIVNFDPQSVLRHGKETQPYSLQNITEPLESRIKPRFNVLLERLQTKSGFSWDPETGLVSINKKVLPNSDIRELALHKVKMDIDDPPSDPPPSFKKFDTFLRTRNINSNPMTRAKDITLPTKKKTVARKRDKTHSITTPSGSFVRY
jgi:hypothetical protein